MAFLPKIEEERRRMIPLEETRAALDWEPRPEYQTFYELAALELGPPEKIDRIAEPFFKMFNFWKDDHPSFPIGFRHSEPAAVMLQYLMWYEACSRQQPPTGFSSP